MATKLVYVGLKPEDKIYHATCGNCGSVVEGQLKESVDNGKDSQVFTCLHCGTLTGRLKLGTWEEAKAQAEAQSSVVFSSSLWYNR